jgi:predicted nucleic acid-binding protein
MKNDTPTSEFVTDTMAVVLRLEKRRMGKMAKSLFESAELGNTQIYIPSMVFAEILYLFEKRRISVSLDNVQDYLMRYPHIKEYSMTFAVIQSSSKINDISELHDRLIAGSALSLGLPLITNDPVIEASAFIKMVW